MRVTWVENRGGPGRGVGGWVLNFGLGENFKNSTSTNKKNKLVGHLFSKC